MPRERQREPRRVWSVRSRAGAPSALRAATRDVADEVAYERYLQFLFSTQWEEIHNRARQRGIAILITDHAVPVNTKWAAENGFDFPVLSDYWPHGEATRAYQAFNDMLGVANRVTYVIDADGVIRDVIATESLGIPREYELYGQALAAL